MNRVLQYTLLCSLSTVTSISKQSMTVKQEPLCPLSHNEKTSDKNAFDNDKNLGWPLTVVAREDNSCPREVCTKHPEQIVMKVPVMKWLKIN